MLNVLLWAVGGFLLFSAFITGAVWNECEAEGRRDTARFAKYAGPAMAVIGALMWRYATS